MLHKNKKLARLLTASLAIAAIAPATAGAVPVIDGQGVAAGGGSGVTPQSLSAPDQVDRGAAKQDLRAPDQVNPNDGFAPSQAAPQWPVNPQPVVGHAGPKAAAQPSSDGLGTEAIVLIALGGVVLVATAGLGLTRLKRVRQRQLA